MDISQGVRETLIGMQVDPDSIRPGAGLVTNLDLDSLEIAELGTALEDKFSIAVPDDLWGAQTVGDLVDKVREASAQ